MPEILTERLRILPMSAEELESLIHLYKDSAPELSLAYGEMLDCCIRYPGQYLWYTSWKLCLKADDREIGYAGFKGLSHGETVEIGYGVNEEHEGKGYATEGVNALCRWAFFTGEVMLIEAETKPDNIASQRVLKKLGFTQTGEIGQEGPRFMLTSGFLNNEPR